MSRSTKQKLQELALEVKLLKEQKAQLENKNEKKAAIFDMMIAIAEQEYQVEARKTASANKKSTTQLPKD
ncbi:hypothetical protein [Chitinophaga sp. sic0106]|uniref:hypothetical protein n=1 Tax=Chitinophaga sp. sic0106 TaxID=2854785 RepID=UPI001C44CF58|nr:hypothetical protein [Chitinophaga sp. sic0106]MBV7529260.1 hypothetical protein [Chitinophaga sp. sic0106]